MNTAVYVTTEAAEDAVRLLADQGIASDAHEEPANAGTLGVLRVGDHDVAAAVEILTKSPGMAAIRCPECGSLHVAYPNQPDASPTAALAAKIAETLHLSERNFFCHECQYEWAEDQGALVAAT